MRRILIALALFTTCRAALVHAQGVIPLDQYCALSNGTALRVRLYDDSLAYTNHLGRLQGQIVNSAGVPLQYSAVALFRQLTDSNPVRRAGFNAHGVFRLESLPPAQYILSVRSLGYQQQWHAVRVLGAADDTLCVRLRSVPIDLAPVGPARKQG
jgi:hypothetical protein